MSTYSTPKFISEPLLSKQIINALFREVNGKNYMYTTVTGTPGKFCVYNMDDKKMEASYPIGECKNVWTHVVDSEGIITFTGESHLYRYDTNTQEFKQYKSALGEEIYSFVLDVDEEDNIYVGTFPRGKIVKYQKADNQIIDLGRVDETAQYVRSIACHKGYIYAGTFGNDQTKFYKIDAKNPSLKKTIDIPDLPDYYNKEKIDWYYTMNTAEDFIIIHAREIEKSIMLVYDTVSEQFIDLGFRGEYKGLYSSKVLDHKTYFISSGFLYAIDIKNRKIEDLNFQVDPQDTMHGSDWITLKGYPDFPGKSLICNSMTRPYPIVYNLQTKKRMELNDIELDWGKYLIQMIENGGDGEIYIGSYAGDIATRYDLINQKFDCFTIGQTEGSVHYKGKQYFGVYTKAWLYEYDKNLPYSDQNPKKLERVEESQDRPFTMVAQEDKIYLGTICDYGQHNGCLGIYDLKTHEMKAIKGIVENQCVMSIDYKDGKIYGSTTVHGGLGSLPIAEEAKLFIYDVEKDLKIKEFSPKIPGVEQPLHIGSIKFDGDGKLWAVSGYTVFCVDPDTEEVSDVLSFGKFPYSRKKHAWRPNYIRFDQEGLLYTNILGIKVINTKTKEITDLSDKTGELVELFTIGSDNNIYFNKVSGLYQIEIN